MVRNGYLKPNVENPKDFEDVVKMRLEAKRTGDKKQRRIEENGG